MRALTALCLLLFCFPARSQSPEQPDPLIAGYVTRVASGSDFDVNGIRILCGPRTTIVMETGVPGTSLTWSGCLHTPPVLGQQAQVFGRWRKKHETAAADRINLRRIERDNVSGFAVIDATAGTNTGASGPTEIRADGYRMLITTDTHETFEPPLHGPRDVGTNVWVEYDANARPDGLYVLKSASFRQNTVTDRENAMRVKTDYDPSAVPADAKPDRVAVAVGLPLDPKQIPPWPDAEQQGRIDMIGQKLVPDWQKKLPASDPNRINFRFQLTDGRRWPWVLALPSGIILIPQRVVDRMQNDSQLAEILADSIACVLEKQTWRMRIADKVISAATLASWASFVPVIGGPVMLASIGTGTAQAVKLAKEQRQSERVSLTLMHDAGYDVNEAPKAWWLLNSTKPQPVQFIAMPDQTTYLYRLLAELWSGQS
jgi:hypothetical protein